MHKSLSMKTRIMLFTQTIKLNDTHVEHLITVHRRTCALLNSVQKFIEMQGCLPRTFFNQLRSFNSSIVQMSENRD